MQDPNSAVDAASAPAGGMPIPETGAGDDHAIIDQFFGDQSNLPPEEPSSQLFQPNPETQPPRADDRFPKDEAPPNPEDFKRWEYQQSRADKYFNELTQLREEQARNEHLKPLAEIIQSDPELLSIVERRLQGMETPKQVQVPTPPVRPDNFNPAEAADPNTPSGKYVKEMEDYKLARIDYIEKRAAAVEERLAQEDEKRQQQEQVRNYMLGIRNELISKHGFTNDESDRFFQVFTDPRSRSTSFLARYFRFLESEQQGSQPQASERRSPLPPAPGGRSMRPVVDEQARFNQSLRGWVDAAKSRR